MKRDVLTPVVVSRVCNAQEEGSEGDEEAIDMVVSRCMKDDKPATMSMFVTQLQGAFDVVEDYETRVLMWPPKQTVGFKRKHTS